MCVCKIVSALLHVGAEAVCCWSPMFKEVGPSWGEALFLNLGPVCSDVFLDVVSVVRSLD